MPFFPIRAAAGIVLGAILLAGPAWAQQKPLTIDVAFDPDAKVDFGGSPAAGLAWLSDTHFLWPKGTGPVEFLKVEALTGKTQSFFDAARIERALVAEGATAELARQAVGARGIVMSASRNALLMPIGGDLYSYDLAAQKAARVTRVDGAEEEPAFSPDGRQVAFVRANDIYTVPASGGTERRLTSDGSADVLNGKLDWVYQEEVYGRGNFRSYWWSPDGRRIAFLRLDEKNVPKYTITDDITTRPVFEVYPYPKAGDPNPVATLGVVEVASGAARFVDLGKYAGTDTLIVDVAWRPDGQVVFQVQDREQTWLDLNVADPATGAVTTLFREKTPAWVEPSGSPRFLKDGSFLWLSERDGWKHLYHYRADGTEPKQVTKGEWEVRALYGVDETARMAYFSSTDARAIDKFISRARLDGSGLTRISSTPGQHEAILNPSFTHYLDTWSDTKTPPQVRLRAADGRELRVVDANDVPSLREYRLAAWEFLQVKTRDGFPMEAALLKPPGFRPLPQVPGLPAHLRRAARPAGAQRLVLGQPVPAARRRERRRGVRLRQPERERQGARVQRHRLQEDGPPPSCGTSRTAWPGSRASPGWTRSASASAGGATAASWLCTRSPTARASPWGSWERPWWTGATTTPSTPSA